MCDHSDCTHAPRPDRRKLLAALPFGAALLWLGTGLRPAHADAPPVDLPPPGPRDTCPVCGMFVAKYPEWVATILFADGTAVHFDGAKDFFKYLRDMPKYAPDRSPDQIAAMGVTEYYGLARVDARAALYSVGSDVLGPMGHELVPLANDADAADFTRDHKGRKLLAFDEVALPLLADLDQGHFE
ncbi:nitrous oxide reductase accessory protein NosL [Paenirhodobacter sp. CAU 1674]|uniref:nitrous oxide reductase accessory protein NosL n=1 Tax=Paenirhodobacter sp. CAU 1674 TaxID=3032596 RepID=UPI0023DC2B2D|nr:nitrous oxide reductase accessory protein NosL [Paenirhodobacter sp. CAU 1674]MDF2140730.1 nitrous oxide reductase accessory protein NosL [Paenirhodobacter sp. CAU 1674]